MPSSSSSSVVPFSSCLQSLPASGSFPMSQLFPSGGQSIGASASASVLPMNIEGWFFRNDWFDLLAVQGTLKSLLQHHSSKASILRRSAFFIVQHSHPYMTTGKTTALTRDTFLGKVMSLLFNMLSCAQQMQVKIFHYENISLKQHFIFSHSPLGNHITTTSREKKVCKLHLQWS